MGNLESFLFPTLGGLRSHLGDLVRPHEKTSLATSAITGL